jgi:hypothetical protein
MKSRYYILLLLSGIALNVFSQNRVTYDYDAAGNRLSGLSSQLRMAAITDQKTEDEIDTEEVYFDKIDLSNIRIYPNPTKGILKIEITRMSEENPINIQLYDMSGRMLINEQNAAPFTDLNISGQPDGTYILTIFTDNRTTHWKIIKE